MLTDERLREIRERAALATGGPWRAEEMTHYGEPGTGFGYVWGPPRAPGDERWCHFDTEDRCAVVGEAIFFADAVFIAHARADVDDLLAEIDRLRLALAGEQKARALLSAGMESQCELMDGMKQELRRLRSELARRPGPLEPTDRREDEAP